MAKYTLVDDPISPYSPLPELLKWEQTCLDELRQDPDDLGWQFALDQIRRYIARAKSLYQGRDDNDRN